MPPSTTEWVWHRPQTKERLTKIRRQGREKQHLGIRSPSFWPVLGFRMVCPVLHDILESRMLSWFFCQKSLLLLYMNDGDKVSVCSWCEQFWFSEVNKVSSSPELFNICCTDGFQQLLACCYELPKIMKIFPEPSRKRKYLVSYTVLAERVVDCSASYIIVLYPAVSLTMSAKLFSILILFIVFTAPFLTVLLYFI